MTRKRFIWKKWTNHLEKLGPKLKDIIEDENIESEEGDTTLFQVLSTQDLDFDFYILQTNFRLTFDLIEKIAEVDGVESINVMSPYKARIGFPTSGLFIIEEVQKCIEELLLNEDIDLNDGFDELVLQKFNPKILDQISEIRESLYNTKDYWAIYIWPNGYTDIITDNKQSKYFKDKLEILEVINNLVGGLLLSSQSYENS